MLDLKEENSKEQEEEEDLEDIKHKIFLFLNKKLFSSVAYLL